MWNTRKQAEDLFYQEIEPLLKSLGYTYNFNKTSLDLHVNGCLIHLRSAEPSSVENIESVTYDWGWCDEAGAFAPTSLKTFTSRIRTGLRRKRFTSMPDEPDAFIYSFLEGRDCKIYEIALADNPDRKFREAYEKELRQTYHGAELERYLSGKRISLSGTGIFSTSHAHRKPVIVHAEDPISLSWDFNVEYRAVSGWTTTGLRSDLAPMIGNFASWKMEQTTVIDDAIRLCEILDEQYPHHVGQIILTGDASGDNRSAQTTESMWRNVRSVFRDKYGERMRYLVPTANPNVKDTIQCANWALMGGLVTFDPSERHTFASMSSCKFDKFGDIDKAPDYTPTGSRTHHADTARYEIFRNYRNLYLRRKAIPPVDLLAHPNATTKAS